MKKILYFIPAVITALFYGMVLFIKLDLETMAYVLLGMLVLSGIILCFNKWMGIFPGILICVWLVAVDFNVKIRAIYLWPVGLVFIVYFAIIGFRVYKQNKM